MPHTYRDRDKLKARLSRIRGQIDAVERALDEHQACGDVLQQIAAIRGAVAGLLAEVLEGHVREHLAGPRLSAADRETAADELIEVLRRYLK
ncbi:MAG: metal/formaldehyde-sensitive transcriptional repressor [Gemmataceae bacterium]|nr:metal/formaldehyde-sensitive transcriptional repressor [Gemmataceae bacterium]